MGKKYRFTGGCLRGSMLLLASLAFDCWTAPIPEECLPCDREMHRTLEAIQAWRRGHQGAYPPRLVDLKLAGLLPANGAICPDVLHELNGANASHQDVTSRREGGDPPGTYEYEMSSSVMKSTEESNYIPDGARSYTRQDVKAELLRRAFFEQVPILRCSSHRSSAPPQFSNDPNVRRNATLTGTIYWSGRLWEQLWLQDVPYCAREANVLFGLKGPPFYTDRAPTLRQALDLRQWSCSFGDAPWWWTFPLFKPKPHPEVAPDLKPLFDERHGRVASLGQEQWWLNGLVQLQGKVTKDPFSGPGLIAFVWKKEGVPVSRRIAGAAWIQGTVWTAPLGQTTGWLIWHYEDGHIIRVPVDYGVDTGRFWADADQLQRESGFPEAVWLYHEEDAPARKEKWLRLYRQEWTNPKPDILVTSLDFASNEESPAAPFLIAVNTR